MICKIKKTTSSATVVMLPNTADYIIWFAKNKSRAEYHRLYRSKAIGGDAGSKYDQVEMLDGQRRAMTAEEKRDLGQLPIGAKVYRLDNLMSQSMGREKGEGAACWFPISVEGRKFLPNARNRWKTNEDGVNRLLAARRIRAMGNTVAYVRFLGNFPAYPIGNVWDNIGGIQSRADPKIYLISDEVQLRH